MSLAGMMADALISDCHPLHRHMQVPFRVKCAMEWYLLLPKVHTNRKLESQVQTGLKSSTDEMQGSQAGPRAHPSCTL